MKNLQIISTTRRTGKDTDAIIAKAIYNSICLIVTYNVLTGDLLIDKWYLIPGSELSKLRNALTDHFKQVSA